MDWSRLDWPLIGALSGFAAAAAAVAIIAIVVLQPTPAPSNKARPAHTTTTTTTTALSPPVQRPVVVPVLHAPPLPELKPPVLVLTAPSAHAAPAPVAPSRPSIVTSYAVEPARKPPPAAVQQALAPDTQQQPARPIKLTTPGQPNPTEQWRVVKAANASAFNLGGHISRAGVVDDMANPHLRDAFKKHPNFHKLPQQIRMHIEMQNINLNRVAPYRHLLGIDDRKIEQEQGVRFERVIASR